MSEYLSRRVNVEEAPAAVIPIVGVSTSTACFLGIVPDSLTIPVQNPNYDRTGRSQDENAKLRYLKDTFQFYSAADVKARVEALHKATKALSDNTDVGNRGELYKRVQKAENDLARAELATKNMEPVRLFEFRRLRKAFRGILQRWTGCLECRRFEDRGGKRTPEPARARRIWILRQRGKQVLCNALRHRCGIA